jgi:hypothetical protein
LDLSGIATNASAITDLPTSHGTTNTTLQNNIDNLDLSGIATNASAITDLATSQGTTNTTLQNNIDNLDLSGIALNSSAITDLQSNVNNSSSNIEEISNGTFTENELSYTYNESNIYMNQLITNDLFALNLTIVTPINNKTYNQKIIIDALEFKGYVNIVKSMTKKLK